MSLEQRCLGDVVEFIRGITFTPSDVVLPSESGAVVCMRTKNIQEFLDESDLIAVPRSFVRRDELFLRERDILISSANSWNLVGKVAQVPKLNYPATAGGFIAIVRAKRNIVDPQFLYRWLASDGAQASIRACSRKTTNISNLSVPQFLKLPITIPEIDEQQRVATILDKADSLRLKRHEAIRLAAELVQAIFFDAFGDIDTNERTWPVVRLEEIALQVTDGEHQTPKRSSEGIYLLSARNIQNGFFALQDVDYVPQEEFERIRRRCEPKRGDILISCSGSIGRVVQVATDDPLALVRSVALVRPDTTKIRSCFLEYLLRSASMQRRMGAASKSSAQANLFQGPIRALPVMLPPIEDQIRFESIVAQVMSLNQKSAVASDDLIALTKSLQSNFFCT